MQVAIWKWQNAVEHRINACSGDREASFQILYIIPFIL
jgi:hypothetical protein